MKLSESLICWTPNHSVLEDMETKGKATVVPWPDREHRSRPYMCTDGACWDHVRKANVVNRRHFVMSVALGLIMRSKIDPAEVHRAMWDLDEYRAGLPGNTPSPDGSTVADPDALCYYP